jgi:16S rRNA (cytosine967-C5)-methyltransferase
MGLYQLLYTRIPPYAAINETVNAASNLNKEWAKGFINATLRNFLKQKDKILASISQSKEASYSHPGWLIQKITDAWPDMSDTILTANNQYPPFCLRVNPLKIAREEYLFLLQKANLEAFIIPYTKQGLILTQAVDVSLLPKFAEGFVSIQDGASQLAAELLAPEDNETILDACAAPGGKTCHILELQPNLKQLTAIDVDQTRLTKVTENLARLHLTAKVICHDVSHLSWWDKNLFDRILLDAPCSALGVIRRHPDIKLLRQPSDLAQLTTIQSKILTAIWETLKPGGTLIYTTCSILPEENERILLSFMKNHPDCEEQTIIAEWGLAKECGRQILPGMYPGMDGFYFAKLRKKGP